MYVVQGDTGNSGTYLPYVNNLLTFDLHRHPDRGIIAILLMLNIFFVTCSTNMFTSNDSFYFCGVRKTRQT